MMRTSKQRRFLSYLRHVPFSLCIRELSRIQAMEALEEKYHLNTLSPVLDIGCGDGFWWTLQNREKKEIYGLDIAEREVKQANKHIHAIVSDISKERPFSSLQFQEIIGNCSLEHVHHIDLALQNIKKTAAPNAKLILFVPTPEWAYQGLTQRFLIKHFPRLAMTLSGALNGFFQHWHLYRSSIWKQILEQNGWSVMDVQGLGNPRAEFLFRLFLPTAFISFLIKKITGHYPNRLLRYCPSFLLTPFCKLLSWCLHDALIDCNSAHAYEYVIVAEVKDDK